MTTPTRRQVDASAFVIAALTAELAGDTDLTSRLCVGIGPDESQSIIAVLLGMLAAHVEASCDEYGITTDEYLEGARVVQSRMEAEL